MSKKEQELLTHEPVFKLKVMGEDRVLCKYIGTIESREKLCDESLELPYPGGVIKFPNYENYEIIGRACSCNIPGGYLLKNKKIPVIYTSMIYASQFVTGCLFNFFLYFTIDQQTSSKLLLPKNYVNRSMSGKFTLELMDAEGFLAYFIKKKKPIIENNVIESFLDKIEQITNDEERDKINNEIHNQVVFQLDKYRLMFEPIPIEGTFSTKKIFTKIENFYRSDDFKELIDSCMEFTQKQRSEKMGGNTLKIPKRVLNLKDCLDDPNKINEYVNNLPSDNESEPDDSVDSDDHVDSDDYVDSD